MDHLHVLNAGWPEEVNRLEAIQHVFELHDRTADEFHYASASIERLDEDTHAALRALGVSEAEIVEART